MSTNGSPSQVSYYAPAATLPGERERLLIVDDSALVRRVFVAALRDDYECVEADSFESATALLKENEFAVVVTDVLMPGISGIELLRRILNDSPDTKVILASSVSKSDRVLDAVRLGAFDYLIKPVDNFVLRLTVERAVEARDLSRREKRYKAELQAQKEHLQQLQATVVHQEKMASLGQLAAGVAHELNNPVGFVHSNLEFLEGGLADLKNLLNAYGSLDLSDEQLKAITDARSALEYPDVLPELESILEDCKEGAVRIRDIVQNLRTFSRLDEAEYKETDINEGIESTIKLLSRHVSDGNIQIIREYGELPPIQMFSSQLNQVWMNLLLNAAQSITADEGTVTVRTRADETHLVIEIEDTGCGIPVQNLNRIFDPFFSTKSVGEGTGLGLSITFSIVERHGGEITVDSKLNEGTKFTVSLPRTFTPDFGLDDKSIDIFRGNTQNEEVSYAHSQNTYC